MPILISSAVLTSAILLVWRRRALRGTTLTHAWWWVLVSLVFIVLGELLLALTGDAAAHWPPVVRLISATSTFCPMMAVLGARRPQHHAWQFVVFTLWIMLSLPGWEAFFLSRPQAMDIGPVRGWFLWLMLLVNLVNWLPTRFWLGAILVMVGQLLMLAVFLPGLQVTETTSGSVLIACLLFTVSIALCCCGLPRRRSGRSEFDRRWLQFRDMFGTMWALRVIERISVAAAMYRWPLSLSWTGFYFHDPDEDWSSLSEEDRSELQQTMDKLLRRFT